MAASEAVVGVLAAEVKRDRPAARQPGSTARDGRSDIWQDVPAAALLPFLEHTPAAVFLRQGDGRFVWTNAVYRRLLCQSVDTAIVGRKLEDVVSDGYARMYRRLDTEVVKRRAPLYDSVPFPRPGGTGRAAGFRFPVDIPRIGCGVGGVYIDVSELEETRQKWASADVCFRAVFDHATYPMAILDTDGRIIDSNPALCSLFGAPHSALIGLSPQDLVDFGTHARGNDLWRRLSNGRRSRVQLAVTGRRGNGSRFRARMTATVVRRPDGSPSLTACTFDAIVSPPDAAELSHTEVELLLALASGASNAELQSRTMLARQTVDYHLANLRAKLGADSRAAIVARAYAIGVLEPGCWPPRAHVDVASSATS
ncbi:PAS domain-containing protein [Streptomyces sp. NPDC005500]|uniref:PAS domain-containing protein n=1 Tax=Streptomyces sp. NPDC005500 TaxID=3155007 RepID=UPI0033AA141C